MSPLSRTVGAALLLTLTTLPAQAGGGGTPPAMGAAARPFTARTVQIRLHDGTVLAGELTLPAPTGKRPPLVILVHGSGANDMNETASPQEAGVPGGSALFLQLAHQLSGRGFAVLRYNKRGVVGVGPRTLPAARRTGMAYTVSGYTEDARQVLEFGRALPEIDPGRVFLLGHSEGTLVVSHLARQASGQLKGVVMIGTVGQTVKASLRHQLVTEPLRVYRELLDHNHDGLVSLRELVPAARAHGLTDALVYFGLIRVDDSWRFPAAFRSNSRGEVSIARAVAPALERTFAAYPNLPFFDSQMRLYLRDAGQFGSVTQVLPGFRGPVLFLQGSDDANTPPAGARQAHAAVMAAGNGRATLKVYSGLGHSLSPSKSGLPTLGPAARRPLDDLTRWLVSASR